MRTTTTIRLQPELARRAKAFARKTDRSFTELVADALSEVMNRGTQGPEKLPPIPVVYGTKPFSTEDIKHLIEQMDMEYDLKKLGGSRDPAA
jgi:hypothetical protein